MQNKGGIVHEPPENLYTTPRNEPGRPHNDRPPALSGQIRAQTVHITYYGTAGIRVMVSVVYYIFIFGYSYV